MSNQSHFLSQPYHNGLITNELPLSVGGGIGQSRTYMLLLKKAHLGEVSVTVWPKILKDMCASKKIFVLEKGGIPRHISRVPSSRPAVRSPQRGGFVQNHSVRPLVLSLTEFSSFPATVLPGAPWRLRTRPPGIVNVP
jgi:hypothetical protein